MYGYMPWGNWIVFRQILALTKGLVKLHGGSIWIQNRPESGLAISFEIPRLAKMDVEEEPVLSEAVRDVGVQTG